MTAKSYLAALPSLLRERSTRRAFENYVTDALRIVTENTARMGRGGSYLKTKFSDILNPKPEDKRAPKEIVEHLKSKIAQIGGGDV